MTLDPLFNASLAVQVHMITVLPAAVIGAFLLARGKGSRLHRLFGKIWLGLMLATSVSSLFIHELKVWGTWSPIHLLSLYVVFGCFVAYSTARCGQIAAHRRMVTGLYVGGIGIAGVFTFMPGRIMNAVFSSGSPLSTAAAGLVILAIALAAWWPFVRKRARESGT